MDKFSVRRKLLKGTLSAPVVVTVASPSSLAAASVTCWDKATESEPPSRFASEPRADHLVRAEVDYCSVTVEGQTFDVYSQDGSKWYRAADGAQVTVSPDPLCTTKRYAVAYLDSRGATESVGWPSGGWDTQRFCSLNCWASISGGGPPV